MSLKIGDIVRLRADNTVPPLNMCVSAVRDKDEEGQQLARLHWVGKDGRVDVAIVPTATLVAVSDIS